MTSLKSTLNSFSHVWSVSLCMFKASAVPETVGFVLGVVLVSEAFLAASVSMLMSSSRVSGFFMSCSDILVSRL